MNNPAYFRGVDVSKDSFVVSIKNGNLLMKNRIFAMNKNGFNGFERTIRHFSEDMLIGMEPAGIYHNNLLNFLQKRNYNSAAVNPYMLHQFFKFTNNKPAKTDKKDSRAIAEFLEFKREELKETSKAGGQRYSVRYSVRKQERISRDIARCKTEIRRLLSLVFPEIEGPVGIFNKGFLSILLETGGASTIRSMAKRKFIKIAAGFLHKGRGRKPQLSAGKIYKPACSSIAAGYPGYEELLKIKIKRLNALLQEREYINKLIKNKAEKLFKREIDILCSIPGIGPESAIYLMAEIVDIKRFEHYRKLAGFCGLDPVIKQSGRFKARRRISKRGNSHARRIAWVMAGCVKRNPPYFRDYYLKKRGEGKSYKEAAAASTRLLRAIFALLNENRRFK